MERLANYFEILSGLEDILEAQDLRESQRKVLIDFMANPTDNFQGIFDLATAFGKTRLMKVLSLAYLHSNPKGKIVIATPGIDTVEQTQEKFKSYSDFFNDTTLGLYYYKKKELDKPIIVTTYHSLKDLTSKINPEEVGLLLLDEAHHAISEKRVDTIQKYANSCCYGMTGTPGYTPDKNLANLIGNVIASVDVPQAVQEGSLSSIKNILLASDLKVDLSQIKRDGTQQEYNQSEYEEAFKKAMATSAKKDINEIQWEDVHREIARNVALFYQNYIDDEVGSINGKKCMINCRSQNEAKIQAEELNKLFGKEVAAVWTSELQTMDDLDRFKKGDIQVVCQVGKLNEGFDMPTLGMCINYPTASKVLEKQRSGRAIRLDPTNPDKVALVVDVAFPGEHKGNSIEAIHSNGQVLYCDVIGTPVVHTPQHQSQQKRIKSEKQAPTTPLSGFTIISNPTHLLSMYQSARGREDIYADMISLEEYAKGQYVDKKVLESHCQKLLRTTFEDEYGNERPLVQMKQKKGENLYFVTSNELGLEKLNAEMQMLNYLDGLKRPDEYSISDNDLVEVNEFFSNPNIESSIQPYIIKALLKRPTYKDHQGKILPIGEIKIEPNTRAKPKLYIHTNSRAMQALMKATCAENEKMITKIKEKFEYGNWISLARIAHDYDILPEDLLAVLPYWEKQKYYEGKNENNVLEQKQIQNRFLVQRDGVNVSYKIGSCKDFLNIEHGFGINHSYYYGSSNDQFKVSIPKDALDDFLLFFSRYDGYKLTYSHLPAILTTEKISEILKLDPSIVYSWLKLCLDEKRKFNASHHQYNLVMPLKRNCPYIYGDVYTDGLGVHQDGWETFKRFLEEKELYQFKGKNTHALMSEQTIHDDRRFKVYTYTAEALRKRYSLSNNYMGAKVLQAMHKDAYFSEIHERTMPVVSYIKKNDGGLCLALSSEPNAIEILEKRLPALKLPPLRSGMITAKEFVEKFVYSGCTSAQYKSWFKDLYDKHETFKNTQTNQDIPFVEKVRDNLTECYALNENVTLDMLLKILPQSLLGSEKRFSLRKRLQSASKSGERRKKILDKLICSKRIKGVDVFRTRLARRIQDVHKKRDAEKSPLTIKAYMKQKKEKIGRS